jgi:tRNA(Ile)-lysidine synthase
VIDRIQRLVIEHRLFEGRKKLLLGVSGGADSVFLLHVIPPLAAAQGITCCVGHVNHQLRGAESEQDETFVQTLAEEAGLPFFVERMDTADRAGDGCSIEMAARADRHAAFSSMLTQSGADAVVLAHSQSDHAETVLLKLCRGSGPDGFAGIAVERRIKDLTILRPLLGCSRDEVRTWLTHEKRMWREDRSNEDDRYLRNRVRREVMPMILDRLNYQAEAHIARAASDLQAELDFLDQLAETELGRLLNEQERLPAREVFDLHRVLALRVLSKWLIRSGCPSPLITAERLQAIRDLCSTREGSARLELGQGYTLERAYEALMLREATSEVLIRQVFSVPCELSLPDWGLTISCSPEVGFKQNFAPGPGSYPATIQLSATRLAGRPIELRAWQAGDRYTPMGMAGSRKLQDIFTDYKVPAYQRCSVPVFVVDDEVVYLAGYRIADAWQVEGSDCASVNISIGCL